VITVLFGTLQRNPDRDKPIQLTLPILNKLQCQNLLIVKPSSPAMGCAVEDGALKSPTLVHNTFCVLMDWIIIAVKKNWNLAEQ